MSAAAQRQAEAGAADARHERDRGCAVEANEARRRAVRRAENGNTLGTIYWAAYATDVESWD